MLKKKLLTAATSTRARLALAVVAATVLAGATVTEASAKARHHHRHHHHARTASSWHNAKASIIPAGRSFSGLASYYGNEAGNRTASGQRFNQHAMTCAHRSLPFGTKLRVTHRGRSVVVTVNDRGPFIRGRVLDLSTGAARAIGMTSVGVGRVTAEII